VASKSDHDVKTRTNIIDLLPEVYRSSVNQTLFEASFNKFLTKDDTQHVAGYIGEGNPKAAVNRQLSEPTSHRQAFQLAPVMYTKVGTEEYTLTFKGFQQQLQLMGVDINSTDQWASTHQFNWVPPVNLDMVVNYADYFWKSTNGQTPAQYFTIENRCNKATSKLNAYKAILHRRGETMDVLRIDFAQNALVVGGKHDDLYVEGFVFKTKGTNNINLSDKTWTVTSSVYDGLEDETIIIVTPSLSLKTAVDDVATPPQQPSASYVGQWWYVYSTNPATPLNQLYTWTGLAWAMVAQAFPCVISLIDQQAVYQAEVNCACESDTGGWDTKQWDDGQETDIVWNTELLANISWATETEWISHNTQTSPHDLWYDTTTDILKQRNSSNTAWVNVRSEFSKVLVETTGAARWDASIGCFPQEHNQWTQQNQWVHKSELTTFVGAKRAQVPILEYSSQTELSEWTEVVYSWKYRTEQVKSFAAVETSPNRLELEPIKSYIANNVNGIWYIYLASERNSANRDIDYTNVFQYGYKFRIVDRYGLSVLFTAARSVYREVDTSDPLNLPRGSFVTVVEIQETDFPAPFEAGLKYETNPPDPDAPRYTRIEPIVTSRGDSWKGYHVHWILDVASTTQKATSPKMLNPYVKQANISAVETITLTEGTVSITPTYQEFIPILNNITQVNLDYRFHYRVDNPGYYAIAGENQLRVYINGVRQYGTYKEIPYALPVQPDYTVVDGINAQIGSVPAGINYVYAIQFDKPLTVNDVVRIEVAPISYHDMGMYGIPVRTVEDDITFAQAALTGAQPVYKPLMRYQHSVQTKNKINQYPLFNLYDIMSGEVVGTSPIFAYAEDPSQPVDSATQRRILVDDSGKEFAFEQYLVDVDNGKMLAYRNITGDEPAYWYSPLTQQLKKWDGKAWADVIISPALSGMIAHKPYVSEYEPIHLRDMHMSVWVNPVTIEFWQRDAVNGVWNIIGGVKISDADPTLHTIWKTSTPATDYVPQRVDENGEASNAGDWEVLSQWRNNPEHENHKQILYSQLITHLSSIVSKQDAVPGLANRGIFTMTQKDYNFGLGGTIKEHNDAFDTLISAVNVTETTPVGVIEFAQKQYENSLVFLRDIFNASLIDNLIQYSGYSVEEMKHRIAQACITDYQNNDAPAKLYNDSTAYNHTTQLGMKNWIATAPMFGLAPATRPHVVTSDTACMIMHHDGHRSTVSYSAAEQDRLCRILVKQFNAASPGSAVISATEPSSTLMPVYWYQLGGGNRNLYKLNTIGIQHQWELVSFTELLSQMYLAVEERLYAAVPPFPVPVFDFDSLTATPTLADTYSDRMYNRFMDYVASKQIKAPFVNTRYIAQDPYTWNYAQCIINLPPSGKFGEVPPQPASCWQALYEQWYNTPYPHLEPWSLQGYNEKPDWWEDMYAETTGSRRWKSSMWDNILQGVIPAGKRYPFPLNWKISTGNSATDGVNIPTYNYVSVNISDVEVTGGYQPDELLPPYYDNTHTMTTHPQVRSIYRVFSTQIVAPNADYTFGQQGPAEWEWSISSEHVYDKSVVAFMMQPAKFLHQTFGLKYASVGGLQIDAISQKVYRHNEALFHGDIYDTNRTYAAAGLNQWYVNFNRAKGYDTNVHFRSLWTTWTPKQSYQTAGIVDTSTLQIFNKTFDVTDKDYSVVLSNSGVIREVWLDAFEVSILATPPAIVQYNNQAKWKLAIDSLAPVSRTIEYYGVQVWPVMVDVDSDIITAFRFDIDDVTAAVNVFEVRGDQTAFFLPEIMIQVSGSSTNDGLYTVVTAVFDGVTQTTRIKTAESIPTSIRDGIIDIPDYAHNWATGDVVVVSSTGMLPYPFADDTPYYVIKVNNRQFKLAENSISAQTGTSVDITSIPTGELTVGKIKTSFNVFNGSSHSTELWYHFELNLSDVRTLQPPEVIVGMQTLINIIDGYQQLQEDKGIVYNNSNDFVEYDSDTGRPVTWQLELERFIDWAYSLRRSRLQINDRFEYTVDDIAANTLRFTSSAPAWKTGSSVALTTSGSLPSPLFGNTPYYIVTTDDPQVFKLSVTSRIVNDDDVVDITTLGSGKMFISLYSKDQSYPAFEINPTRNNTWIDTPQGMLSNVLTGPYSDIRVTQAMYDQYGRVLSADKIVVYRQDQQSRVSVRSGIPNDVELYPFGFYDPYNFIHIGGGHFFAEGYEHIIMFNNYTVGEDLVYDPFLGLYTKRFDLDYYEKIDYTLRPTLGGYYLTGNEFKRNFEGSIQDIRDFYDAYNLTEGTPEAQHARQLIGYNPDQGELSPATAYLADQGAMSYLDLLNVNSKSKFMFYRGMIQSKGSVNSVKAYINSKKFADAKLDEFWMYKIGDFGESRAKVYPRLRLFATDAVKSDIRFKFTTPTDVERAKIEDMKKGFETVSFKTSNRWVDFPQQREEIQSPLFLDAELTTMTRLYATMSADDGMDLVPFNGQTTVDFWVHINTATSTTITRSWSDGQWSETETSMEFNIVGQTVYVKLDSISDGVRVLRRRLTQPRNLLSYRTEQMNEVNLANGYTRVNSEVISFASDMYAFTNVVLDVPRGTVFYIVGEEANKFVPGDKILVAATVHTVISSEYFTSDNTTRVLVDGAYTSSTTGYLTHYGFADVLIIFTVNPSANKITPAHLMDVKSHTKLTEVPLWHPALGVHSPNAIHNVDLQRTTDPARYTTTLVSGYNTASPWLGMEAGTTWLDTSQLEYLPYYDDVITPDIDKRIYMWGKRPTWSNVKVYQWVETLIRPENWVATASKQQNDMTIPQQEKVTGSPRKTMFKRTRNRDLVQIVSPVGGIVQLQTTNNTYKKGAEVLFSVVNQETDTLPETIQQGVKYVVSNYNSVDNTLVIVDENETIVDLTGATSLYVVQPFEDTWYRKPFHRERLYAAMEYSFGTLLTTVYEPKFTLSASEWEAGDVVDVYVNGTPVVYGAVVEYNSVDGQYQVNVTGSELTLTVHDVIDIVRPVPALTQEQFDFDPDFDDDGSTLEQWREDYEYSSTVRSYNGITYVYYYYWVENMITRRSQTDPASMSITSTAQQLAAIPTPYMIVQDPWDDLWLQGYDVPPWDKTGYDGTMYLAQNSRNQFLPSIFYRKAILTKVTEYVSEDNRYVIEFTRDLTLRNTLDVDHSYMNVKNKHEKWFMFRREQVGAVPRDLWIKMVEALMGCKYDDFTVRVPSFEREHYDLLNGTETRYGLEKDQIFVNPVYARATIINYLQDPAHDFKPVDINHFFEMFPADTDAFWEDPQQVKNMCEYMYTTFDSYHTNGIWFDVLSDALVTKSKYKGLMKTSWLALHGIRILDVAGAFDD
jgi:hypothetical protein